MKKIAFVTCASKSGLTPDDALTAKLLSLQSIQVVPQPWDQPADWNSFDLVVLRSCWNYHLQPENFERWLSDLEQKQVPLQNPAKVIRWNMHKGYLSTLADQGIALPATVWLPKGASVDLRNLMLEKKWNKVVVKPAVSATAFNTFLVEQREAANRQPEFINSVNERDMLVQQFMPEVQQEGEWSLLFFDKQFSHAVLKKPKANDFRVQNDFGGTFNKAEAPVFAIERARKILEQIEGSLLYTRIDGIIVGGQFLLMELELIEPVLFLAEEEMAAARFATAIMKRL